MFGYISINQAEMKFKDYDMYHSYYCGLCNRLKERYGRRGQITLSYDMTFLIVLLTGLYEPGTKETTTSCIVHPFRKHTVRTNVYTDYAADMNLLLTYYKCEDDWHDEKDYKRHLFARMLNSKTAAVRERYPQKTARICAVLDELSHLEKTGETDLDKMAGLSGDIMAEIFACRQDQWEESLRRMGFFLGKFIYLLDAYEDVEDDIKTGSYNPLKKAFRENEHFAGDCRQLLTLMIAECSREFEKLPVLLHADILRNILYSGVWCRYFSVTKKREADTPHIIITGENKND